MQEEKLSSFIYSFAKLRGAMSVAYLIETGHGGMFASRQSESGVTEYFIDEIPSDLPFEIPDSIPKISAEHLRSRAALWMMKTHLAPSKAKIIVDFSRGFWIEPR